MPTYTFNCATCDRSFRKLVSTPKTEAAPCPLCNTSAQRLLSAPAAQFSSGKTLGDSGVYDLDYNPDKNVGRDATERWEVIKDRESQKRRVKQDTLKRQGFDPYDPKYKVAMRRTPEGEYQPMSKAEVGAYRTLRKDFNEMSTQHRQERVRKGLPQVED